MGSHSDQRHATNTNTNGHGGGAAVWSRRSLETTIDEKDFHQQEQWTDESSLGSICFHACLFGRQPFQCEWMRTEIKKRTTTVSSKCRCHFGNCRVIAVDLVGSKPPFQCGHMLVVHGMRVGERRGMGSLLPLAQVDDGVSAINIGKEQSLYTLEKFKLSRSLLVYNEPYFGYSLFLSHRGSFFLLFLKSDLHSARSDPVKVYVIGWDAHRKATTRVGVWCTPGTALW